MAGSRQPSPGRVHRRPAVPGQFEFVGSDGYLWGAQTEGCGAVVGHARRRADMAAGRHRTRRRGRQRDRARCLGAGAHLPADPRRRPARSSWRSRSTGEAPGAPAPPTPRAAVWAGVRISTPGAGPDHRRTRLRADRVFRSRRSDHLAAPLHRRRRGDVERPARALQRGLRPRCGSGCLEHRRPVAALRGSGHRRLAVEAALPLERRGPDLATESYRRPDWARQSSRTSRPIRFPWPGTWHRSRSGTATWPS